MRWNTATTFAAIGLGLAGAIWTTLAGFFLVFIPAGIAACLAAFLTSTHLGELMERALAQRSLSVHVAAGIGVALATLFAAVVAVGLANVLMAILDEISPLNLGLGPYHSLAHTLGAYLLAPLWAVMIFGSPIAVLLGAWYGYLNHSQLRRRLPQ